MPLTCLLQNRLVVPTSDGFTVLSIDPNVQVQSVILPHVDSGKGHHDSGQNGSSKKKPETQPEELFICATGSSKSGKLLAVADATKQLFIYDFTSSNGCPCLLFQCTTERKACHLTFTNTEKSLVVLDRTGDVFNWNFNEAFSKPTLLLGHLSVVLDLKLSPEDKCIVTCDRDEKIRVSNYPNSYNIHSYCLGHKEFVSSICLSGCNKLLSGSGDKTIRLWEVATGKQLYCYDCQFPVKQLLLVDCYLLVTFFCERTCQLVQLTEDDQLNCICTTNLAYDVLEMHPLAKDQVLLVTNDTKAPVVCAKIDQGKLTFESQDTWANQVPVWDKLLPKLPKDDSLLKFRLKSCVEVN